MSLASPHNDAIKLANLSAYRGLSYALASFAGLGLAQFWLCRLPVHTDSKRHGGIALGPGRFGPLFSLPGCSTDSCCAFATR